MSEIMGVLFAIFVGIMVIPQFSKYQTASNDNTRAAITAQQQKQLITAGTTYVQQNSVAIQGVATATVPAVITVAMLQAPAVNLLPASFSATNPYGQTWQIEVLQPTAGNLQALAMSTGGTALPDSQAAKIAAIVGATGGLIPQNDSGIFPGGPASAYGAYSGWTISTANYTGVSGGHPAALMTFNNGTLVSNYLYRTAVPGQPQLNQMSTALDMNGNAINNAATVQLNTVVTSGTACPTNGVMARDANGAVMSCQNLLWKSQGSAFWQDPVANVASLPACNAASAWSTRVVDTPTVGSGPRAYTCNGATWQPIAVDDSGNITIAGTATMGQAQINTVVVENTACPSNGLVARDATGLILSCQSGVWKTSSRLLPVYSFYPKQNIIYGQALWGVGKYDAIAQTFTGYLVCNPTTDSRCGSNWPWGSNRPIADCGVNGDCAIEYASVFYTEISTGVTQQGFLMTVKASNLPVDTSLPFSVAINTS